MSAMVMVRAGNKQNSHVAVGMAAVAQVVTALAIQRITVLGINIGVASEPVISLQFDGHLREALGDGLAVKSLGRSQGMTSHIKRLGGCLLEWQQADVVH